jgi:hypothetical protein
VLPGGGDARYVFDIVNTVAQAEAAAALPEAVQ